MLLSFGILVKLTFLTGSGAMYIKIILYSGKVWLGESLANLENHP